MKATNKLRKTANTIIAKYTRGYITYQQLQDMYKELEQAKITTGILSHGENSCEWYYDGEEVDGSLFVYSLYRPFNSPMIEVNAYMS